MAQNDLMSNAEDVADQVREQKALPVNLHSKSRRLLFSAKQMLSKFRKVLVCVYSFVLFAWLQMRFVY